MSWYKHSKLLMPSEKLATEETVLSTFFNNRGHGTDKPSMMLTICKWLRMIRLMVECNDLRRRSASKVRNDRIRRTFNTTNKTKMPNTANTTIAVLPLSSFAVLQGTHDDRVVRECPGAHDWHKREVLRNPNCTEHVALVAFVNSLEFSSSAPGQAGG